MNDQFDKALVQKIKETLEAHTEEYVPGEWEHFKATRLAKKSNHKRHMLIWLGAAAASLHLAFAATYVFTDSFRQASSLTDIAVYEQASQPGTQHSHLSEAGQAILPGTNSTQVAVLPTLSDTKEISSSVADNSILVSAHEMPWHWDKKSLPSFPEMERQEVSSSEENGLLSAATVPSNAALASIIVGDQRKYGKKGTRFGFTASTSFITNVDQQFTAQPSIGGGLTAEVPLTKSLDLQVGLLVNRHSLALQSESTSGYSSVPASLELVSLDIPVNLKYNLPVNTAANMYLAAGLSSLTYLKENRTFSSPSDGTASNAGTVSQEVESKDAFSRLDLGRLLNVSFGLEYNLQDNLTLVVEPFYKHSIAALTSENVRFGYGGVNLRLNIGRYH